MGLFSRSSSTPAPAPAPAHVPPDDPKAPVTSGSLFERPGSSAATATPPAHRPAVPNVSHAPHAARTDRDVYLEKLKVRIHQQLVERLDFQNLKVLPPDTVRQEVRQVIRELCKNEKGLLNSNDQERLMDQVMDETFGLGPLEALLKDLTISDILVNRYNKVFIERNGKLSETAVRFKDDAGNVSVPVSATITRQ